MRQETGKIDGDHILDEDLALCGMVVGTLTVPAGITLELDGTVTGDLVVEAEARAEVRGTVLGAVENRGGDVAVYGTVGAVHDIAGSTFVDPDAVVRH